ncbi:MULTISPECIES: M20 metallopeptidase family protein [Bacillus]|uniref:Peptidase M20 n=2 Tax=Bacillus TaxID=1386 RepID=A0A0M4FRP5_9BACI|nr:MULTISPECIES: amidohydrolase [Bacillus]ALC80468.1 peptidase M20 [Bacillus gobiensis]MBP1083530.1 amidohydrolase [Bacillus capparidis]MED1094727.1 amidohydrolase [Bacillus capparidis]
MKRQSEIKLFHWHEQLLEMYEQMVEWRRHMHQYPELSNQEIETSNMIAGILSGFGIDIRTRVGGMGVVGTIKGEKPGKTIALRADFDALPIQDEKEVPYKSKVDGVMHACGHDGHTATLLAVAKILNDHRDQLSGNVVLLHQHSEESLGGANEMIADGCLDGVDVVFGNHLWTPIPTGTISYTKGYTTSSGDGFQLKIQGKGGHGSSPHETVDAIIVANQIINQLQLIVSRKINPQKTAVVSVGSFHAGNAANIIADSAELKGTVRTYDKEVQMQIEDEMNSIIKGICAAHHAEYEFKYYHGVPGVYNHAEETDIFCSRIKATLPEFKLAEAPPLLVSEDFGRYLLERPGMFFFTGAGNQNINAIYPHHHPKFDFDERAMVNAGKAMLSIVHHYLVEKAESPLADHVRL